MKKIDWYSVVFYLGILVVILLVLTVLNVLPRGNWIHILAAIYCVGFIISIQKRKRVNKRKISSKGPIKMGDRIDDNIKELIKQRTGEIALIDGAECSKRKKMLGSEVCCKGCPSELPCSRMLSADLLVMKFLNGPKGFFDHADYKKQEKYFTSTLDKIVKAKTLKELKDIVKFGIT